MTIADVSVRERLRKFFLDNPDEELTIDDVVVKFDCSLGSAYHALRFLRREMPVERLTVYRLKERA